MTNLVTDIEETAAETPAATALGLPDGELTYGDLWDRTGRFARALADAGLDPGDRVGVYLPNVEAYVTAFLGTLRAGGIVVPMNPQYRSREISHLLADSGAKGVLPLFHLYGMTITMLATLFEGGSYWPLPKWDAEESLSLIYRIRLHLAFGQRVQRLRRAEP